MTMRGSSHFVQTYNGHRPRLISKSAILQIIKMGSLSICNPASGWLLLQQPAWLLVSFMLTRTPHCQS